MGLRNERIVRLARVPLALRPVPIYAGAPPEPIDCDWLVISSVTDDDRDGSFILYFVDRGGRARELLQFESLEIALDQAHAICGFAQSGWTICSVLVSGDKPFDVIQLEHAFASST
jgi:hypothetical protein